MDPPVCTGRASIASRSTDSRAADSAYSGVPEKLLLGAPWLVCPPDITYSVLVVGSRSIPLVEWFSSDRGRPRTSWTWSQLLPFHVSLEITPEFVSRFTSSPPPPPPMRGSDELT